MTDGLRDKHRWTSVSTTNQKEMLKKKRKSAATKDLWQQS